MTQKRIAFANENYEEVFLVGFRLQPGPHEADIYALVLYYEPSRNDKNRPLMSDGRILFFRNPLRADAVLALGDAAFRKYGHAPVNIACVYDLNVVFEVLESGVSDLGASVVDFVNELLDFVEAAGFADVEPQITTLRRLADFLTFDKPLDDFFRTANVDRRSALAAVQWAIGAVVSRSTMRYD